MWRWGIRVYVEFVVFVVLLFSLAVVLIRIDHVLVWAGLYGFSHFMHEYVLVTAFLMGLSSGQICLGSNFTGRGWFRSKSGMTYEGFKLEELKSWNWLIASPVLLAGIFFWFAIQKDQGVLAEISWRSFYRGFLAPQCSNEKLLGVGSDLQCSIHLVFLGAWIAAVGYSLAPLLRNRVRTLFRSFSAKS